MTETTQMTDAEYRLYERMIQTGHRVRPDQFKTCPYCNNAYRVDFSKGSSQTHCADEACKHDARIEQLNRNNEVRNAHYRISDAELRRQKNHKRKSARTFRVLSLQDGFCYV